MKNDTKEQEKLTELLSQAEDHPIMQKIKAAASTAILKKRQDASGKIEDSKKERDKIIPELRTILVGAEERFKAAKKMLDIAAREFDQARAALAGENNRISHEIGLQEQGLIESAAPEIDEAITFFKEKLDFLRSPGRISRIAGGAERNVFSMKKTTKQESNRDAVLSALAYCQASVKLLEAIKLEPELDVEKIEKMKAEIPSIDVYTEFQGEKPLPRQGTNPMDRLPSDSQLNWQVGKIMEKTKKILKR